MESSRKPKLSAHDKFLKKFEYTNALDSVLQVSQQGGDDDGDDNGGDDGNGCDGDGDDGGSEYGGDCDIVAMLRLL
jgi:hypothetical protein